MAADARWQGECCTSVSALRQSCRTCRKRNGSVLCRRLGSGAVGGAGTAKGARGMRACSRPNVLRDGPAQRARPDGRSLSTRFGACIRRRLVHGGIPPMEVGARCWPRLRQRSLPSRASRRQVPTIVPSQRGGLGVASAGLDTAPSRFAPGARLGPAHAECGLQWPAATFGGLNPQRHQ